jgi:hypothetical protein
MSASWALQQAVFAALSADTAVHALIADRLYDAVPRGAAFPYVVIGDAEETAAATEEEHTLSLHIWSRGGGHREIKTIAAAVRTALETAALAVAGHTLIDLRFSSADYARQSDGETTRAVLRFKAVTERSE